MEQASIYVGDVIDKSGADKVKSLVSEGILWLVQNGMTLEITPYPRIPIAQAYLDATEKYPARGCATSFTTTYSRRFDSAPSWRAWPPSCARVAPSADFASNNPCTRRLAELLELPAPGAGPGLPTTEERREKP